MVPNKRNKLLIATLFNTYSPELSTFTEVFWGKNTFYYIILRLRLLKPAFSRTPLSKSYNN